MGPLGLHGGGEYLPGDEPFLRALLGATMRHQARPTRIAIVPTAAAGQRPDLAGRTGVDAFCRVAADAHEEIDAEIIPVVDADSAADPALADRLAAADLIHLPGGDPGLVPAILGGSRAWRSILEAWARGTVLAGASAGAMGLCEWTWTPRGVRPGLGLVRGLVVVPHFERIPRERWEQERGAARAAAVGLLGVDERTAVLTEGEGDTLVWRVIGPGRAHWLAPGADATVDAGEGETMDLPGVTFEGYPPPGRRATAE